MVREWISAHSSFEVLRVVGILLQRTKVENPVIPSMAMVEEPFHVLPSIPIIAFKPTSGVSHDNDLICDINEVYSNTNVENIRRE